MFGKTMSIPDDAMPQWFRLAARATREEVEAVTRGLDSGSLHPGETKRRLARAVVSHYHSPEAARHAEEAFNTVFRAKGVPDDVPTATLEPTETVWLPKALVTAGLATSNSEARRLISAGAVKVDGVRITDETLATDDLIDNVVQVGKRRFVRFIGPPGPHSRSGSG